MLRDASGLQVPALVRAMGFGDDYTLDAVRQRRDRIEILGNGVPPPVTQAIMQTLTADPCLAFDPLSRQKPESAR